MSHEATNWAIKQRGLSPAAKLVLWHLADAYHPDHGCFPSQERLSRECEMPRSTLNTRLDELESKGLIRREARINPETKRQLPTLYRLRLERGFTPAETAESGPAGGAVEVVCEGAGEGESRVQNLDTACPEPCPEIGGSRVQLVGHGYNAEPVSEPVRFEREGRASAGEGVTTPAAAGAAGVPSAGEGARLPAFAEFWAAWLAASPVAVSAKRGLAEAAWSGLGIDQRRAALAQIVAVLAKHRAGGRTKDPAPSTYLTECMWERLTPATAAAGGAGAGSEGLPAWGKGWWAVFWAKRAAGGPVKWMWAEAERARPWHPSAAEMAAARPMAATLINVTHDHEAARRWWDVLRAEGLRLPFGRDEKRWVFVPGSENVRAAE